MATNGLPYGMTPDFERAVAALACSKPSFYARVGAELEPEAFTSKTCQLLIQATQQLARELGRGPDGPTVVLQRIRRWSGEGQVTLDALEQATDVLLECLPPSEDEVIAELVPQLQRRLRRAAAFEASHEVSARGDLSKTAALIERANKVGQPSVANGLGFRLGPEVQAEIDRARYSKRLPTGLFELDSALEGGLIRGGLGVAIGGPGEGKSFMLTTIATAAALGGMHVAFATLELPVAMQAARLTAAITGVPVGEVLDGTSARARQAVVDAAQAGGGRVRFCEMAAYATTVGEVIDWVDRVEQDEGRAVELLVVDYGDKVGSKKKGGESDYATGREVYEGLRLYASDKGKWCWTASQSRRKNDKVKAKVKDLDSVADSMHKVRVADVVVTLNGEEDDQGNRSIAYFVAKHRTGEARQRIGPYPTDFAHGKMVG